MHKVSIRRQTPETHADLDLLTGDTQVIAKEVFRKLRHRLKANLDHSRLNGSLFMIFNTFLLYILLHYTKLSLS